MKARKVEGTFHRCGEVSSLKSHALVGLRCQRARGVAGQSGGRDELLGDIGVEVGALYEAEEELVDDLEMWPCELEDGLVFFRVESITNGVDLWWDGSEQIGGKHGDDFR